MAQPVWVLSVDLQTKTATFTSGLADAAKGARTSFQDIKSGADDMGRGVGGSMTEARHGVMLLGEEFGVHLPRALTSFIASIGPVGAAMEASFPFIAILVGATLLLQHLAKLREEGGKLTESQTNFGTTVSNVLNGLNDKLLEAGIRTDELNGNHLAALNKQLQRIDNQSMKELVQSFDTVAKAADVTFAQLKTSWYQWGVGSAGAQASMERFKTEYDSLLAHKDEKGAQALLDATIAREEKILSLRKQANDNQFHTGQKGQQGDYGKFEEAKLSLKKMGLDLDSVDLASQQKLVFALQSQLEIAKEQMAVKQADKGNAVQTTGNKIDADGDKQARAAAEALRQSEDEKDKIREEAYRVAVTNIQENERQKIDATDKGSQARLSAISAAIQEENSKGLQETSFYRDLLNSRIDLVKQMSIEEKKLQAEAGKEAAEQGMKMDELKLAAEREHAQLTLSVLRNSEQQRLQDEIRFANEDLAIKMSAAAHELAALDQSDKDYENKKKALMDKEEQLVRAHENQVTQIKEKAEQERNARIVSAESRANDEIAQSATNLLMRKESIAKTMISLGDQVMAGIMQNAIKSILADNMTKEHDAAAAARKAFLAGESTVPGVAGVILGGALAAAAFASVMAFQSGGIVPGVGTGDTVPAMLEPGEGVLSNKVMDRLSYSSKFGSGNSGPEVHVHHHATYHVQAIDRAGVREMLDNHKDEFAAHVHKSLRGMNKG